MAIVAVAVLLTPAAGAVPVTFNPAAAGLGGAAFQFDTLKAREYTRIDTTVAANGDVFATTVSYAIITGALLGGVSVAPPGLNSSYSLYLQFPITFQRPGPGGSIPEKVLSAAPILFGANGLTTGGLSAGNVPFVTSASVPVKLLSGDLISGKTGANLVSPNPLTLDLNLTLSAAVTAAAPGFLDGTAQSLVLNFSSNDLSPTVTVLNGGATLLINGGSDTITFSVPEPASVGLLASMAGLALWRRRAVR